MFLVILMQALFAITFPFTKLALGYTDALFLSGARLLLASILFLAYSYAIEKNQPSIKRHWWLLLQASIFYTFLTFVPEALAMETISSIKSNLLWSFYPFVSALLSYYLLKERLTKKKWLGMGIGLVGMIPIFATMDVQEQALGEFLHISMPELFMVIAVASTAYSWFLIRRLMQSGFSLARINGITMFVGGALGLGTRLLMNKGPLYHGGNMLFSYIFALIIASNLIGYPLYGYLLKRYSITFLSFSGFVCPIFGAVFSSLMLGETIHCAYLVGFVFIFAGLSIFSRDELHGGISTQP
jgi:drug/metabolite transporter (DMT)-like permease